MLKMNRGDPAMPSVDSSDKAYVALIVNILQDGTKSLSILNKIAKAGYEVRSSFIQDLLYP